MLGCCATYYFVLATIASIYVMANIDGQSFLPVMLSIQAVALFLYCILRLY